MKHLQMNAAILGASTTQTQLQQYFGPGFEEIKQHLNSCHAYQHGESKVLPLLCSRGTSACSFSLILLLGVVIGSYLSANVEECCLCVPGPSLCGCLVGVHTSQGCDSHQHWNIRSLSRIAASEK